MHRRRGGSLGRGGPLSCIVGDAAVVVALLGLVRDQRPVVFVVGMAGRCSMLGGMRGTAGTDGSFTPETKAAVLQRARSECERCGRWCGDGAWREFHHRNPRGMGGASGERAEWLADAANCLLLCHLCHRWIETHRSVSLAEGWLVEHEADPRGVPATIYRRGSVRLGLEYVRPVSGLSPAISAGRVRVNW